jgi:hypothetical protein
MRLVVLALPLIVGMCAAAPAVAQMGSGSGAGGLSQFPDVQQKRQYLINLGVYSAYDTDIAQTSKAAAALRGIVPEDWLATPTLSINAVQPVGANALFVRGQGGYTFHRQNQQLDSRTVGITGGGVARSQLCQLALTGAYAANQTELGLVATALSANVEERKSVSAAAQCGRPTGLNGMASVSRTWVSESAALARQLNSNLDNYTLGINFRSHAVGMVGLTASYLGSEYPDQIVAVAPAVQFGQTVIIRNYGLTYANRFGARLKVDGSISETSLTRGVAIRGISPHSRSTSYRGDVVYTLSPRLEFEALGDQSVVPSSIIGKLYEQDTNSELIARYKLGTKISLTVGVRRQDIHSNTDPAFQLAIFRKSRTDIAYGSIRFALARRTTILLDVRQQDRTTDLPIFDYSSTRASITLNVPI